MAADSSDYSAQEQPEPRDPILSRNSGRYVGRHHRPGRSTDADPWPARSGRAGQAAQEEGRGQGGAAMSRADSGGGLWLPAGLGLAGAGRRRRHDRAVAAPGAEAGCRPGRRADGDAGAGEANAGGDRRAPAKPAGPARPASAAPDAGVSLPPRRWTGPGAAPPSRRGAREADPLHRGPWSGARDRSSCSRLERSRTKTGDSRLTLDELAGARLAASEHGNASLVELAAIADAEVNRIERAAARSRRAATRPRALSCRVLMGILEARPGQSIQVGQPGTSPPPPPSIRRCPSSTWAARSACSMDLAKLSRDMNRSHLYRRR